MKKFLLGLCFLPAAAMAQKIAPPVAQPNQMESINFYKKSMERNPVGGKFNPFNQQRNYDTAYARLGYTYYDLMTNGTIARRVQAYSGNKYSVVWTGDPTQDNTFPNRGTAYTHYNGTSWSPFNQTRIEPERSGWPTLSEVDGHEWIISHFASIGTDEAAGGTFWMKNASVGNPSFNKEFAKDMPKGPYWPRAAASGDYIHAVAVYNNNTYKAGVRNPVVYYRYNVKTQDFEADGITLPGYDSTRVVQGAADEYSIDVRDSVVAILIGGTLNDLMLFKSNDFGKTWNKTIVDSFALAPLDLRTSDEFDTTWTNDGTANVILDNNNNAHVFYVPLRIIDDTPGDSSYSYFFSNYGVYHWSELNPVAVGPIGYALDYDKDDVVSITPETSRTSGEGAGYGGNGITSMPVPAIDAAGNLYVIYSACNEVDLSLNNTNFRHIYVVYSKDNGATWSEPQDLTQTMEQEHVYASTPRMVVDGKLAVTWMRDEIPGVYLVNSSLGLSRNEMMFKAFPAQDILDNKVGIDKTGIRKVAAVNQIMGVYPNPANSQANVMLNVKAGASATVEVTDMLGRPVIAATKAVVTGGNNVVTLNTEGLNSGAYLVKVVSNGAVSTARLIISK